MVQFHIDLGKISILAANLANAVAPLTKKIH